MKWHADAETLAAFREGLLPRRRAARVTEHVARCSQCAELDRRMAGVTRLLADSPAPPMPAAVTARIEAALAAEAAARSAADAGSGAAAEPGTATPARSATPAGIAVPRGDGAIAPAPGQHGARPRRTRAAHGKPRAGPRLSPRLAAAAMMAAFAAVVAGGGYALSQLGGGSSSGPASEGTAHSASSGLGGSAAEGRTPLYAGPSSPSSLKIVRSGTDYRPDHLAGQVSAVLAHSRPSPRPRPGAAAGAQASAFSQFQNGNLPACVRRVTGGLRQRVVDLARYQGRPAAIIVVLGGGGRAPHVWVVGLGCSGTASDVLAQTSLRSPG